MASFQSKIGWKRLRKRENKNYRSPSFLHDALPIFNYASGRKETER